jgi:ATP phosphoribosyltransferase
VFLPSKDIAHFVGEGNVDIGLTGQDMVAEVDANVKEEVRTGFGRCKLVLLAPTCMKFKIAKDLIGKRIATSFPLLSRKYFSQLEEEHGVSQGSTAICDISGSVEAACGLGLADAVVDLWETGTTAKAAGLEVLSKLMDTEVVLISNPQSNCSIMIERLRKRIDGFVLAQQNAMMHYNVSKENLADAVLITPGRKKPTLTPLNDQSWFSVGVMVAKCEVNNIMDQLHDVGATDVVVIDLMNCRS